MKATVNWQSGMTFKGQSESGHQVILDGDNPGEGPSPMEMVLMSVGSCSAVDVVSILQKAKQDFSDVTVEVTAERAETVPRVFTKINLHFVVIGNDVSDKHVSRAVSLSADKYCSVAKMLETSVNLTHSFEIKSQ